jgi:hypothetical protein
VSLQLDLTYLQDKVLGGGKPSALSRADPIRVGTEATAKRTQEDIESHFEVHGDDLKICEIQKMFSAKCAQVCIEILRNAYRVGKIFQCMKVPNT